MSRRHTSPHIELRVNGAKPKSPALKTSKMTTKRDHHSSRADGSSKVDADMSKKNTHRRQHSGGSSNSSKRTVSAHCHSPVATESSSKNLDFLCPICLDLIIEAHITRCGHTFCYRCISKSVEMFKRCPKCSNTIATCDQIFPNYLLDELIIKFRLKKKLQDNIMRRSIAEAVSNSGRSEIESASGDGLKNFLATESQKLTLPDVNIILGILNQRKQLLEAESTASQNHLLYDFLKYLQFQKKKKREQIENEIHLLEMDLVQVEDILKDISLECGFDKAIVVGEKPADDATKIEVDQQTTESNDGCETVDDQKKEGQTKIDTEPVRKAEQDNISGTATTSMKESPESIAYNLRKRRMLAHFDEFAKSYFFVRNQDLLVLDEMDEKAASTTMPSDIAACSEGGKNDDTVKRRQGLDIFRENLVRSSKYGSLHQLCSMLYSSDSQTNSTIVSTIVFDKDADFFAIGGVTRRIKIFDYMAMVRDNTDIHYPVVQMISKSKISCLSWNPQNKNILAASDYIGGVNVWDVHAGTQIKTFQEHEKRCWSVDFNDIDTRVIASGSDDGRVKLWSLNQEQSVATLETKANVCCVKFNPISSFHLAFGSADQDVHYYDLRHLIRPLAVLRGHKKAVSYVKFLNGQEIVSASTDSQLKLWNIHEAPTAMRTFHGHLNEKNFVGLATDGDYIACGSEDNAVYIYYKGLSKPLFNFRMDDSALIGSGRNGHAAGFSSDSERFSDANINEFVSAVSWRSQSNAIVAANSRGLIKVLELV